MEDREVIEGVVAAGGGAYDCGADGDLPSADRVGDAVNTALRNGHKELACAPEVLAAEKLGSPYWTGLRLCVPPLR